ncbi:MAG: sensor histidine kinase [Thermoleophilia bacterium]
MTAATAVALLLALVLTAAWGTREDIAAAGDRVARAADAAAPRIDLSRPADARAAVAAVGASARVLGPAGRVRLQAGDEAVWSAGAPGWPERLATTGTSGWSLRDGAVEASRDLTGGGTLVVRQALGPGVGSIGVPLPALALAGLLALVAGALAWLLAARSRARLRRMSDAARAAASGRPVAVAAEGRGEWRRLSESVGDAAVRVADLQDAVEARVEPLVAALTPLAHPVAARTPAGGLVRNAALELLIASLAPGDAGAVEDAVRLALSSSGATSRRLVLDDGRALEVEAWSVPGGRLVSVGERTEQERLAALRRQVTGAAARHLQAPVYEVQALAGELLNQLPGSAAPVVRRIEGAAGRMERLVGRLLRGTENDPHGRPLRVRAVGAAGIAYGLGREFDRKLRDRGLRLETSLPDDLPALRADPALVHEILTELVANAATFTPRGGTITLAGRLLPGGSVELSITDTGPGLRGHELPIVGERFARGVAAMGFPGAGLGLGVARALAERMGGRLVLEAGPGGRARLELPAAPADGAQAPRTRPESESEREPVAAR